MRTGHTLLAELLSSGEVPLAAAIYNHSVEKMAQRGAPVKWKALAPTFGRPEGQERDRVTGPNTIQG
jgi:iron(III) transport system substrate-binding protein